MDKLPDTLVRDTLALDKEERAFLAAMLLESLEPSDPDAHQQWKKEIEKRLSQLDAGEAKTIPWNSVRARLSRKLDDIPID